MYDIRKALRRFKPLIRWTAYRFSTRPNPLMSFEDIEAEGFLTLVKCCREFPDGQKRFGRYFKHSWYNRLKDMNRYRLYLKRQGIEVELECAENVPVEVSDRVEFIERMRGKYEEISPLLSEDAKRLLLMLLDPTPAVNCAYEDFLHRQQFHERGHYVTGYKKFRIQLRHIRFVLGMSKGRMWDVVKEVKSIQSK